MKNIAIFASGSGSNFKSIHHHILLGIIPGEISIVISNNPTSGAIKYAKTHNIPTYIISKNRCPDPMLREQLLTNELLEKNIDLICLAGYIKLIPKGIVGKFKNRILNIHPSLLPKFGGKGFFGINVHQAVIESGSKETGVTIHFVDDSYDSGKIIEQKKINVLSDDTAETLASRVLKIEHMFYPKIIKAFCEGRILWNNIHSKVEIVFED